MKKKIKKVRKQKVERMPQGVQYGKRFGKARTGGQATVQPTTSLQY